MNITDEIISLLEQYAAQTGLRAFPCKGDPFTSEVRHTLSQNQPEQKRSVSLTWEMVIHHDKP